jgi:transposase
MGKKATSEVKESLAELKRVRARQKTMRGEKRVLALIHIKTGRYATRGKLAEGLGVHIRTLERWMRQYAEDGIDAMLADMPRPKPSKIITDEMREGLRQRVNDPTAPFLGYWEARQWVLKEYGTDVSYHWLRAYMIKHFSTKVKRPRKSHVKKDPEAMEAFFKTPVRAERDQGRSDSE